MRVRALLFSLATLYGCNEPATAEPGTEAGPCIDGQCVALLICLSDVCVSPSPDSEGGTADDGTAGASDDGSNDDSNDDSNDNGNEDSASADGATDPDGPKLLSFGVDSDSVSEEESVTFVAVVTDPDGVGDIVGGTLTEEGGGVYGAFITSGEEGAYQATITCAQLHEQTPIVFDQGGSEVRTFVAEFFDQAGHTVTRRTPITLTCDGGGACDGSCKDLDTSWSSCGECGNTCPATEAASGVCWEGECGGLKLCSLGNSCDEICASEGKICGESCRVGGSSLGGAFRCASDQDVTVALGCGEYVEDGWWTCCCF